MIRVLHVLGSLNRGGAETWLMHMLRATDPSRFRFDFLVHSAEEGQYEREARELGARVMRLRHDRILPRYALGLRELVRAHGPFDILHSHVHLFSGVVLAAGALAGIPHRIAHAHNDTRLMPSAKSPARRAYRVAMNSLIRGFGNAGAACALGAGQDVFGDEWRESATWKRLYCGIDLTAFRTMVGDARAELGIPPEAPVLGHIGRFSHQKNHAFLIRIFEAAQQMNPATRFVLVGDGELRAKIEPLARQRLGKSVHFTGVRTDVPRMFATMDCQVMPSHHEGLPLAVLEAQAAGVPSVISTRITDEVAALPELIAWRSLTDSPETWAASALELAGTSPKSGRDAASDRMRASRFSMESSHAELLSLYEAVTSASTKAGRREGGS